jgi:hypothetical protein
MGDGPVGKPLTTDVDQEYSKHCFLKAKSTRGFTNKDIHFNDIYDSGIRGAPEFVADHQRILSQKRELAPEVLCIRTLCFPLLTNEVRSAT